MSPDTGKKTWRSAEADAESVHSLAEATGLSPLLARILASRGVADAATARAFLSPDLKIQWRDPLELPGMSAAAAAVASAVREGREIVVFGDFDLDGLSAAAIATLGLRQLGARARGLVPHRFREGYGLTPASVERVLKLSPDLVVTVDCGISAGSEVAALLDAGVDVVVTDHHEPAEAVPLGVPIVDPKSPGAAAHVFRDLSGAGVALKLVQAVGKLLGDMEVWKSLADLAALGTIGDIVPLVGENRAVVSAGLAMMRENPRAGLKALAEVASIDIAAANADQVAYALAPRLNAAGRMGDSSVALELLMEPDPKAAWLLARTLDEQNRIRQAVEQEVQAAATEQAQRVWRPGDRVLVLAGEGWHEGVKGIVASRLAGTFGVPVVIFCLVDDEAHGSGRTAGSVDLFAAVKECAPLLTRYGGHSAAVGVTLPRCDVDRFAAMLREQLGRVPEEAFRVEMTVDAEVPLEDLGVELAAELSLLEPHGHGNLRPLLVARGVFMGERKRVGRTSDHLRFTAFDGTASVPAIAFRCREIETMADQEEVVDLAFELIADEWRGRRRVQLHVKDHRLHELAPEGPAARLVEDLFAHADEVLAARDYDGIGEAEAFHTKLAGVTFEGRQEVVARLAAGTPLRLERQPDNPHDPNACALFGPLGDQVGYLNRRLAAVLAPIVDAGVTYDAEITEITGRERVADDQSGSLGVNVLLSRRQPEGRDEDLLDRGDHRSEIAALSRADRDVIVARALIGDAIPHDAQREALALLGTGMSTLAVMATGRGKSFVFHAHAAMSALEGDWASVFVYPLRSLVADQAFSLEGSLGSLGLNCAVLTGDTPPASRDALFEALGDGDVDVVLTTPESLERQVERFAASGRVRFVCVDEVHHISASASHRPAYARLSSVLSGLGHPVVFGSTATAADAVVAAARESLGMTGLVVDPTVRENLRLEDRRGRLGDRESKGAYLSSLIAQGEKVIAYVNSREGSVRIAQEVRSRVPSARHAVAYYNGGLTREARHAVEHAFRRGDIRAVVATSAFGEGIDVPDVRHVVLYHMPFSDVEFNQVCGRVGRDGLPATVHTIFGERDAGLNERMLESVAPHDDDLRALYVALRRLCEEGDGEAEAANATLAEHVRSARRGSRMTERGVSTGVRIMRELGLLDSEGTGGYRRLRLRETPGTVELADSVRYTEGRREQEDFVAFKEWVLGAPASELLARFNRPILPTQA